MVKFIFRHKYFSNFVFGKYSGTDSGSRPSAISKAPLSQIVLFPSV